MRSEALSKLSGRIMVAAAGAPPHIFANQQEVGEQPSTSNVVHFVGSVTVAFSSLHQMSSDGPTKPKPGLSLYANLLEPGSKEQSANTITGAPVIYKLASNGDEAPADEAAAKKQQINAGR